MSDFSFPASSTVQITFAHGEQPSPVKMQGAFRYLQNGFVSIENFLGNGQDYNTPTESMQINSVSAAIGSMSNVYLPTNLLGNLSTVYGSLGSYNSGGADGDTNPLTYTRTSSIVTENIQLNKSQDYVYIPVPKFPVPETLSSSYTFGIVYQVSQADTVFIDFIGRDSNGDIIFSDDIGTLSSPYSRITLGNKPGANSLAHAYISIPTSSQDLAYIRIYDSSNSNLTIYSLYLFDEINTINSSLSNSYNPVSIVNSANITGTNSLSITKSASAPTNQAFVPQSCSVGVNCIHAGACSSSISDSYCLGNTYDVFTETGETLVSKTGKVVCSGAPFSYAPDDANNNVVAQSNLSISTSPYKIKFMPYLLTSVASTALDTTRSSLYALELGGLQAAAPVNTRTLIDLQLLADKKTVSSVSKYSPTILGITDTNSWIARTSLPMPSSFTVVGGYAGLSLAIAKTLRLMSGKTTTTSVYAE